eukprot:EC124146.1.p1 GENE.EC124146.1~~EC124146.1.p1  ORF type:complete len:186 (+),score=16.08 EC124146.1:78-635(+)
MVKVCPHCTFAGPESDSSFATIERQKAEKHHQKAERHHEKAKKLLRGGGLVDTLRGLVVDSAEKRAAKHEKEAAVQEERALYHHSREARQDLFRRQSEYGGSPEIDNPGVVNIGQTVTANDQIEKSEDNQTVLHVVSGDFAHSLSSDEEECSGELSGTSAHIHAQNLVPGLENQNAVLVVKPTSA